MARAGLLCGLMLAVVLLAGCGGRRAAGTQDTVRCFWTVIEYRDIGLSQFDMRMGLHGRRTEPYPLCWDPGKHQVRPSLTINHRETWPDLLHDSAEMYRCQTFVDFGEIRSVSECRWGVPGWVPVWVDAGVSA